MKYIYQTSVVPTRPKSLEIKIKTALEVKNIVLMFGDPHDYTQVSETKWVWNKQESNMELFQQNTYAKYFKTIISPRNARCRYYFLITLNDDSQFFYGQNGVFYNDENPSLYNSYFFPYIHDHEVFTPVAWVKEQAWLQIFVDRFSNGNTNNDPQDVVDWNHLPLDNKLYYGGDLKGITNKLDDLLDLGITALYLTPIFQSPSVHKYDTTNYFEVDEIFGTKEELQELVDECHKRDMKIILDAVFNHCGYFFDKFQDVVKNKEQSKYKDWFHITTFEPFEYEMFASVKKMPKLNTSQPELQQYLIEVLLHYLDEFNIDGWRFDVANELDHTFIKEIHKQVKSKHPQAYLMAEIWHDTRDFVRYDEFDANMEYELSDIYVSLINKTITLEQGLDRLTQIDFEFPSNQLISQFHMVDSHDTARLINKVNKDVDGAYMALFCLSLLPGSICYYYGTDLLLEGENDPFCRAPYPINPTQEQLEHQKMFKQILAFRKENLDMLSTQHPRYVIKNNCLELHYPTKTITLDFDKKEIK